MKMRGLRFHPEFFEAMTTDERLRYAQDVARHMTRIEKQLQNLAEEILASLGIWYIHLPTYHATRVIRAGIPDLLCCVCGRFIAIELKADKGRTSRAQIREMGAIQAAGGTAYTARSPLEVYEIVTAWMTSPMQCLVESSARQSSPKWIEPREGSRA